MLPSTSAAMSTRATQDPFLSRANHVKTVADHQRRSRSEFNVRCTIKMCKRANLRVFPDVSRDRTDCSRVTLVRIHWRELTLSRKEVSAAATAPEKKRRGRAPKDQ